MSENKSTFFSNEMWYRLLEGVCQLFAVILLGHSAWLAGLSKSLDSTAFIKSLPIPALLLLISMFFRFLYSSTIHSGASPFIASILGMFQLLDITGVHLLMLCILAIIGIVAGLTDSQQLKDLTKYLVSFFAGMQLEKKRERASAKV